MSNGPPSRDRRSLQDLAKLASSPTLSKTPPPGPVSSKTPAPPPVSSKTPAPPSSSSPDELAHDSGIVDLKMIAQADEGAAERSQRTPLASAPLFDEEETPARPSSPAPAGPSSGKAIPASAKSAPGSSPKPTGSGVRPRAAAAVATPASSSKTPLILGLSALLLIGVGGAYFLLRGWSGPPAPVAGSQAPTEPAATPAAAKPAAATPATSAAAATPALSAAPAAAAEPANEAATDDEAKSPGTGSHPSLRRGSAGRRAAAAEKAGSGGSTVSPLAAMMASATAATPPPPADTPVAPAPAGALGEAVQHAVGANGAAPQAAPAAPVDNYHPLGSVPQTPSQGAITSALGSVLPTARACLNPDDPISKAHITFGSSGAVTAVKVTGHAAGTPVEGCIKSALLKATVPAFADSSFGATVTVRPN